MHLDKDDETIFFFLLLPPSFRRVQVKGIKSVKEGKRVCLNIDVFVAQRSVAHIKIEYKWLYH